MHPFLHFVLQGALTLSNPAPADSVFWLPHSYDGFYAHPNGGPTWSPGDEQLAFSYFDYVPPQYFNASLEILQVNGTWRHCAIQPLTQWGCAAWSPLGDAIAVNDMGSIVRLDPDDCSTIGEIAAGYDSKWSTDGQRIVFSDGGYYGPGTIYTVSAAGGDVRVVVSDGIQPDWSPDGTSIVFVRQGNLWTVGVDGANEQQITHSGQDGRPAWSRDGNWIAFARSDPDWEHTSVWLVGAHGGPATQVAPSVEGERRDMPTWSRDGTRLTYFVMNPTEFRIGVGILRNVIPLAVEGGSWGAIKKKYR